MLLGLIPARGGSKGIPRKNLARLGGRPLIEHTLQAAAGAKTLGWVAVTSDDAAILMTARRWGVDAIKRPARFAADGASMFDTVRHALEALAGRGARPEAVVLLQPTSPFRTGPQIDEAVQLYRRCKASSLVSVHKVLEHPCECVRRQGRKLALALRPPAHARRRQDYPEYFYINGAIYITQTPMLLKKRRFWDERAALYIMPPLSGMDIDEPHQLALAQALWKSHLVRTS